MATTISNIITNMNSYIGDTSNDRITEAERFQYITESTAWLLEELGNEHMVDTYDLKFYDGVYRYKITNSLEDLLVGADLRQSEDEHVMSFIRKSPREISEEIGSGRNTRSWAIERYNGDAFLIVNHKTKYPTQSIATFDTLTADFNGLWQADTVNSDAINISIDNIEKKQGSGCLKFDIDVTQSGADDAVIFNSLGSTINMSQLKDIGAFIFDVFIPDVTEITSITFTWSSDLSATPSTITNYWSATTTVDYNGNSFIDGWNKIKIDWNNATITGNPDSENIAYLQFAINYTNSQVDNIGFRLDNLTLVKPETLTFHYISAYIGTNSSGTDINAFTATTDIPFFSGVYDQYKYVIAHKAASLAFYTMRLREEAVLEDRLATDALERYRKNFESSKTREEKNFKVYGLNFRSRRARFNKK
jgi:hypothetical protein